VRNISRISNLIQIQTECASSENVIDHPDQVSRAYRYAIHTPIRFRESGTVQWHEGTTVNISLTGILFQSDTNLPPQTLLEMQITLPQAMADQSQAKVLCWGPVVRLHPVVAEEDRPALAAIILRYHFGHD
jgi:hypothetical protein